MNPGGRDPRRDFPDGAGSPNDPGHAPVNFHGYAACTGGVFHCETKAAIAEGRPVLLLLRGSFRAARTALGQLQEAGLTTAVSLKETGLHQIAQQLAEPKRAGLFREVVAAADGFLAATPEAVPLGAGEFIPTPYPLEDERWDFARPVEERRGIFIGTREWDVPSRHHLAALQMALTLGGPVTLSEPHPRRLRQLWNSLGGDWARLQLLPRRLPYRDYLAEMARHRLVLQADKSAVPGQVAGDALLCRLPCVGGDGAIDRLGFPRTCGFGRSLGELAELAVRLLRDGDFYVATIAESQATAREKVSFASVACALEKFFGRIARRAS
ncbi:MAG: hypothetical protein ACR2MW_05530 [Chthoniobacterales bacterium]